MIKKMKKIWAALLAVAMLLGLSACSGESDGSDENIIPESSGGKEISRSAAADKVFSLNSNSNYSFNPLIATNHANQLICDLVYEDMVVLDNNFELVEGAGVIVSGTPNEDGTVWEFKIEPGHTFHDGSPVTARDLSYSLGAAIYADRYKGRFSSFKGASATDEVLQVSLGIGDMQFIKLLDIPIIKSGSYGEKRPMGSGPYTYNEDGTALVAYEGYHSYDTLPVDTIYLKEYQTADSIISAFEDSLIDMVQNDPSSYTNLGFASTNETHSFATTNMHYVAFNEDGGLTQSALFRVAMQYAFDREYLVELLNGNGVATAIPMYPTCSFYPSRMAENLSYNLETCVRILESAGVKDYDEDGLMEYMAGTPQDISLTFVVCSDSSAKGGIVRRFQEDMESIGITVNVQELTWENYLKALDEGKFDMYYGEVRLRNNFDLTELLQVRDEDEDEGNTATNMNFTNSRDSAFEGYINEYLKAGDAGRFNAYQTLCNYICNETGSLITIGFEKHQLITHRGVVKGINANMGNPVYNIADWEIFLD
ncbi:MAG: hypothetical protein DBX49_00555 [Clostridia bacterium]|nr:MAG: hypothetical protein DBX49_00555 [Clostridia bacterium]